MPILGHLQLRIMHHIWRNGQSTVHDVHDALNAQPAAKQLAYTTVLTVMRNLGKKDFLDQKSDATRSHTFSPLVDAEAYKLEMVRQIRIHLFGGDVERLLACIADDEGIEAAKRAQIHSLAGAG